MKKIFIVAAFVIGVLNTSVLLASNDGERVVIEIPKQAPKSTKLAPSEENGDKRTGVYVRWGEHEYEVWLNKNNKAFIWVPKADGTGSFRKYLGAEVTSQVLMAKKK